MIPRVRVVVFDLGKVLLDFDYGRMIQRIASESSVTEEELHQLINQSPLLHEFETGLLSADAFFATIKAAAGFRGETGRLIQDFGDIFTPIPAMISLHERMRAEGTTTAIFSNTNETAVAHIRRTYPFFHNFDHYFFSFEERLMKPALPLYHRVQERLGVASGEILYIDDRLENVEAGREAGWRTIHHLSPEDTDRQTQTMLGFARPAL